MDLSRFVRITCDGSDSSGGTGYLLHGDLVLTARHVVKDALSLEVHYDGEDGPASTQKVRIVWQGENDLDVAVLAVETGLLLARQELDPRRFRGELPWRSRGWARVAPIPPAESTSVVDAMAPLGGRAYEFSKTASRFELGVDDPPSEVDWWKGASGAPVFSDRWLLGVIAQGDKPFEGRRLTAVPITALWGQAGFLEAIGHDASWQERRERRTRDLIADVTLLLGARPSIVADLTSILEAFPAAAEALAAEVPGWLKFLHDPKLHGAEGLARALVSMPSWRALLSVVDRAHEKAAGRMDSVKQAKLLRSLLDRALPEVYAASEVSRSPFSEDDLPLDLPVASCTLAEIALAAIDGRATDWQEIRGKRDLPRGRAMFQFESLAQPTEFDYAMPGKVQEWILLLAHWIGMPENVLDSFNSGDRLNDLSRAINGELERDVRREHSPRRYFLFTPDFQEMFGCFIKEISARLPALQLVVLTGRNLADEYIDTEPLRNILFYSSKQSKNGGHRP